MNARLQYEAALKPEPTALVVEPAPSMARLIHRMVRSFGFRVLEAKGPDEALAKAEEHGPDLHLLITELSMTGVSGLTLAAFAASRRPGLPVVFLCDEALSEEVALPQAAALILKPFTREQLLDTITLVTARR